MSARCLPVIWIACLLLAAGCSSITGDTEATTVPSTAPAPDSAAWWEEMARPLHGQGQMMGTVYAVTIPRKDLYVQSAMGDIPVEAGLSCKLYFYRCPCGLIRLVGEFVLGDYEVNGVIDSLRGGDFTIVSISPILLYAKPPVMSLRFETEGHVEDLIATLRGALDRTGKDRQATRPSKF